MCLLLARKQTSFKYSLLFPHSFPLLFSILTWCEALHWLSPKLLSSLPSFDLHYVQLDGLYFKTAVWRDLATSSWPRASNTIWQIPGPMIWWHILSFQWAFLVLIMDNFTSAIMSTRVMKKLIWLGFCTTSYKHVNWLLGILESHEKSLCLIFYSSVWFVCSPPQHLLAFLKCCADSLRKHLF